MQTPPKRDVPPRTWGQVAAALLIVAGIGGLALLALAGAPSTTLAGTFNFPRLIVPIGLTLIALRVLRFVVSVVVAGGRPSIWRANDRRRTQEPQSAYMDMAVMVAIAMPLLAMAGGLLAAALGAALLLIDQTYAASVMQVAVLAIFAGTGLMMVSMIAMEPWRLWRTIAIGKAGMPLSPPTA